MKSICWTSWAVDKLVVALQVEITLPWVSTHHHQTRCFAHLIVHGLVSAHTELFIAGEASESYSAQLLQQLLAFTAHNPAAQRLLDACPLPLDTDFGRLSDPSCLLQGKSVLVGSCESEPVECATASAIEQMSTFLEVERRCLRQQQNNGPLDQQQVCKVPSQASHSCDASTRPTPDKTGALAANPGGEVQQGYQRKVEPWAAIGGAQAHSMHAAMGQGELLSSLMGCALEFGAGAEPESVPAPVQKESMRAELLSETGALLKNLRPIPVDRTQCFASGKRTELAVVGPCS